MLNDGRKSLLGSSVLTKSLFGAAALICGASVVAQQLPTAVEGLAPADEKRWQPVAHDMSPQEYSDSSRQNLRLIRKTAREYILQASAAAGLPKQGVELTGAALGLIVEGAKINLNESKTMAVRLDQVADDDRAISIRFKLEW